ncbi:MAG: hypothetical protein R2881_11275, partial [Eubacteriales bacterium]
VALAKIRRHSFDIFAYAVCVPGEKFITFHQVRRGVFRLHDVENSSKARKITIKNVDNYVDGVDRNVNIHDMRQNIYTSSAD